MRTEIKTTDRVLVSERTAKIFEIEAKLTALGIDFVNVYKELYPNHEDVIEHYTNAWGEALDCVRMLRDNSISMAIEDIGIANKSDNQIII